MVLCDWDPGITVWSPGYHQQSYIADLFNRSDVGDEIGAIISYLTRCDSIWFWSGYLIGNGIRIRRACCVGMDQRGVDGGYTMDCERLVEVKSKAIIQMALRDSWQLNIILITRQLRVYQGSTNGGNGGIKAGRGNKEKA